jgi:hypothetical protein
MAILNFPNSGLVANVSEYTGDNGITYTWDGVKWIVQSVGIVGTISYTDLTNQPSIPAAQIQSNWTAVSGLGVILNKPTISTDINQLTDASGLLGQGGGGTTYITNTVENPFSFSVAADDSTQRVISTNEVIKFAGAGGITTASDAEGNITITGTIPSSLVNGDQTVSLGSTGTLTLPAQAYLTDVSQISSAIINRAGASTDTAAIQDAKDTWLYYEQQWIDSRDADEQDFTTGTRPWYGMPGWQAYPILAAYVHTGNGLPPNVNLAPAASTAKNAYLSYKDLVSNIDIVSGNKVFSFENTGNLTLPGNIIFPDGTTQSTAFSFSVAADDSTQRVISTNEVIKFVGAGTVTTSSDTEGNITITGGSGSTLVNGARTVSLGSDGSLTLPGDIRSEGNINIDINLSDSTLRRWQFGEDGQLTFPDGTNQTTAFTGASLPTQTGNSGKFLTTDGSSASWVTVPYFVLTGSTSVYVNQVVSYTINDYDAFTTYSVAVTSGTATIAGQTITFTAPAGATSVTLTISNGTVSRTATITVLASGVQTPVVTTPASSPYSYYVGTIVGNSYTFATGAFVALGVADTHLNSDWQLASDSGFNTIVQSSMASTNNKTTWAQTLSSTGTFYLRVRHRGTANGASAYSTTVIMTVLAATVQTPTISSPASGTTNYNSPNITFASSAFTYLGTYDAHASSDWQLSTDSAFGTTVQTSMASTSNLTSWTVSGLSAGTTYYARVRYTGSTNGTSSYSAVWNITTINTFSAVIATPTATPAIGASFEGGYYAGMIWNEVVQSSTSFALGTGQKTFVVADMTSVPLVYVGQTLEVRSRAHPGCKMLGTVAGAGSTNLIVNVSSTATESPITITAEGFALGASGDGTTATLTFAARVPPFAVGDIITVAGITGGASGYNQVGATVISCNFNYLTYANATTAAYTSGGTISLTATTFSDWSIMAQYRIIVAPKASGDTGVAGALAWKNTGSQGPTNSATLSEGRKSTLAMINAGNSTVYPAAWFCYNLNIASRTDWYLPARDELALAFRSFRPMETGGAFGEANAVAGDNAGDRAVGYVFDYKTFGSPGDTSIGHGVNVNSSPPTTAYTLTVPDQTTIAAFQLNGAQVFDIATYWTSSDYAYDGAGINYSNAWGMGFDNGNQAYVNKQFGVSAVRAVRRSII